MLCLPHAPLRRIRAPVVEARRRCLAGRLRGYVSIGFERRPQSGYEVRLIGAGSEATDAGRLGLL